MMNVTEKRNSRFLCLLLAIVLSLLCRQNASAAGLGFDPALSGSISVTLRESGTGTVIPGSTIRLYKVGEWSGSGYALATDFLASGLSLRDLNAPNLAVHCQHYAETNGLSYTQQSSDSFGTVHFPSLSTGVYLLVEVGSVSGFYPMTPFLATVPIYNAATDTWEYDVDASPKVSKRPIPSPGSSSKTVEVVKNWKNSSGRVPVTVVLLRDGVVEDTVELNEANSWTHIWSGLNETGLWNVVEHKVPEGYSVSYQVDSYKIIITNTGKKTPPPGGDGGETPPPEEDPKDPLSPEDNKEDLPQTGQLKWPVPFMAGFGLLLFLFGWFRTFSKRYKQNEK